MPAVRLRVSGKKAEQLSDVGAIPGMTVVHSDGGHVAATHMACRGRAPVLGGTLASERGVPGRYGAAIAGLLSTA